MRPSPLWLAGLFALLLAGLQCTVHSSAQKQLRAQWFDAEQRLSPRLRVNDSVVVVSIDDESLTSLGQWPWPRQRMAELLLTILAARPAAVGFDVVFAEPDRYGAAPLARTLADAGLANAQSLLAGLADGDEAFAKRMRGAPVVLGAIGLLEPAATAGAVIKSPSILNRAGNIAVRLPQYAGAVRSLPAYTQAAAGEALLDAASEAGVSRRLPSFSQVNGQIVPGLAVELLRVASQAPHLLIEGRGGHIQSLGIGEWRIPTDADGGWWLHYSPLNTPSNSRPHLSAARLLSDAEAASLLTGRIVLVGYTASGLLDVINTPLGPMPGVEAHAEAIDNLLDGRLLHRPQWAPLAEALALLLLALLAGSLLHKRSPAIAALGWALGAALLFGLSNLLFHSQGWLLDAPTPSLAAAAVLALQLLAALAASRQQRLELALALQASRETQARIEGELDAAHRLQLGMLPNPKRQLGQEQRVQLAASMRPARSVGGDFYDCFIDAGQLWFLVADVSGKGLPAALFMAVAKGALRRAALQAPNDPGLALQRAAKSLEDDNPGQNFVTVVAGTLNLATGALQLSSAGHEAPLRLRTAQPLEPIALKGGPPLCVMDDFVYPSESAQLRAGEALCLFTDGATDARNPAGQMLGREAWLVALAAVSAANAETMVGQLMAEVDRHTSTAEVADDVTVLVIRWLGSAS